MLYKDLVALPLRNAFKRVSNDGLMKMNRATSFLVCRRGADVATAHSGTKKRFEIFF